MMEIVDVIKKNKTIWLLGIFMGIFFSGLNALGRYLNGAVSEGLPGILTTFVIWLPVAFGVSALLLAGIRRGTDWISATRLEKKCGQILTGKKKKDRFGSAGDVFFFCGFPPYWLPGRESM